MTDTTGNGLGTAVTPVDPLDGIHAQIDAANLVAFFGTGALEDLETRLTARDSRVLVRCRVRAKEVLAKREEIVRQLWLYRWRPETAVKVKTA